MNIARRNNPHSRGSKRKQKYPATAKAKRDPIPSSRIGPMPPLLPMRWRHVIINTKSSWLHGEKRGFRSRGHRIHSSGDYRNPPPFLEHSGLRIYHQERAEPTVFLDHELWPLIGRAIRDRLRKE